MSASLTILFHVIDAEGHVNANIGIAERLKNRGHRIVFVTNESHREKLISHEFIAECVDYGQSNHSNDSIEKWANIMLSTRQLSEDSPAEKYNFIKSGALTAIYLDHAKCEEPVLRECVERYKPDIFVIDAFIACPALIFSGKPWVMVWSGHPIMGLQDVSLPPVASGLPTYNRENWTEFSEMVLKINREHKEAVFKWYEECGHTSEPTEGFFTESPYLNVYGYPKELDYSDVRPDPPHWYRVDYFMRTVKGGFELPERLRARTAKLVYFSMGTMGSINVELITRLVAIMAKSRHSFIVVKGPLHYKYELPDNMWGEKFLPQTLILPFVDLVITHGGNNTVTEALYYGKPLIVMPLFGDQFDNAQRLQEKGVGVRLDPHRCGENELLEAIEQLLNDRPLRDKLKAMSERMQTCRSIEKLAEVIENLICNELNNNK